MVMTRITKFDGPTSATRGDIAAHEVKRTPLPPAPSLEPAPRKGLSDHKSDFMTLELIARIERLEELAGIERPFVRATRTQADSRRVARISDDEFALICGTAQPSWFDRLWSWLFEIPM